MTENKCPQCGAAIDPNATECKFCGEKIVVQQATQQIQQAQPQVVYVQQPQPQVIIQQAEPQQIYTNINPAWPIKNKTTAGVLAILLGSIGIHKFYLGQIGKGILYLLFCWTGVPSILGLVEGITYLCQSDENFQIKNQVRIG